MRPVNLLLHCSFACFVTARNAAHVGKTLPKGIQNIEPRNHEEHRGFPLKGRAVSANRSSKALTSFKNLIHIACVSYSSSGSPFTKLASLGCEECGNHAKMNKKKILCTLETNSFTVVTMSSCKINNPTYRIMK